MANNHFIKQCIIILYSSCLLTFSVAGIAQEGDDEPGQSRAHDCISQSSIRDYQVLDDKNLIVRAGANSRYHVELMRRAFGLESHWKIGFKSRMSRVCGGSGDLIVDDGFGRPEAVPIASIRKIEPDEVEELLVRFGKKDPDFEHIPAQQEVEGAEVEELD
jgi:hypothetical protein